MQVSEFKIHPSSCGDIMGAKGLGKTGQSYVENWYKEQLYSRRKSFSSKYTDKGNLTEADCIELVAEVFDLGMLAKNEQTFSNDFMIGTPDIITSDLVIDVKSSWSAFSFPLFDTEVPNKDYALQLQCYMALTGLSKAKLVYCLMDTPDDIVQKEAYYQAERTGVDFDEDFYNEFKKDYIYSHLPTSLRVKSFDIERNDEVIKLICDRVKECRTYLETIKIKS